MSGETILIVDDEAGILRLLRLELSAENYTIVTASRPDEALSLLEQSPPDVIILDIMDTSGLGVLRDIRARSKAPVIVLSAHPSEQVRIDAVATGADDFISKPFMPEHVTQSVRFLLGKDVDAALPGWHIPIGDLDLDLHQRVVRRGGQVIPLNRSEWKIVEELARARGQPRLYQELLSAVWGSVYRDDLDFLRIWITRLRSKLGDSGDSPKIVLPYFDIGYRLNME